MLLCYAAQLAGTGLLLCNELHTSVLARRLVVCVVHWHHLTDKQGYLQKI